MCRGQQRAPRGPMLVSLLLVVLSVAGVRTCLQCERTVKKMLEDFVLSEPDALKQIELQGIVDQALESFKQSSLSRMGVVDLTTLYRARTEFQSEFDRFLSMTTGTKNEATQIMEKGQEIFENHLDSFIPDGLCPNKCGLLIRRVMDCNHCNYKKYTCPSPTGQLDCGVFSVQAEEGDQAVIDCFLPWHRFLLGKREYHYSWAPGVLSNNSLSESDFKVLVVTEDSSVVLNQLRLEENGTYRCSLQNQTGTVFYKATFILSVSPDSAQSPHPVLPVPPLLSGVLYRQRLRAALIPAVAVFTGCSLAGSLGLIVLHSEMWKARRRRDGRLQNL